MGLVFISAFALPIFSVIAAHMLLSTFQSKSFVQSLLRHFNEHRVAYFLWITISGIVFEITEGIIKSKDNVIYEKYVTIFGLIATPVVGIICGALLKATVYYAQLNKKDPNISQ